MNEKLRNAIQDGQNCANQVMDNLAVEANMLDGVALATFIEEFNDKWETFKSKNSNNIKDDSYIYYE